MAPSLILHGEQLAIAGRFISLGSCVTINGGTVEYISKSRLAYFQLKCLWRRPYMFCCRGTPTLFIWLRGMKFACERCSLPDSFLLSTFWLWQQNWMEWTRAHCKNWKSSMIYRLGEYQSEPSLIEFVGWVTCYVWPIYVYLTVLHFPFCPQSRKSYT